jgi:succinate-semialdehyde dehydrogenase/glutarate-semialdehyde dehydrogenase
MNEEPFGPLALVSRVKDIDSAIDEANRLPFGLAAYGFTRSAASARRMAREVEAGMMTINHLGLALAETPFGGIKESGYGSEGGTEALMDYTVPKFVSLAGEGIVT